MSQIKSADRVIIVGLGVTGIACAQYFDSIGQAFSIMDEILTKSEIKDKTQGLLVEHCWDKADFDAIQYDSKTILFLSPGISLQKPFIQKAIASGARVSSDLALFDEEVSTPIIAVTGTNGKSTVVTLLAYVLEQINYTVYLAGNIGVPVLSDLEKARKADFIILELSSFQLDLYQDLKPLIGVLLNVSEDHLERYINLQAYVDSKKSIFKHAKTAVYCKDDRLTKPLDCVKSISFGLTPSANFYLKNNNGYLTLFHDDSILLLENELKLKGKHNTLNVLAVMACCHGLGINLEETLPPLKTFEGISHRCQEIANINGVIFINDSKGTNPGACIAALKGFGDNQKRRIILIAGGLNKNNDFSVLTPSIVRYVKQTFVLGRAKDELLNVLPSNTMPVSDLEEAVKNAEAIAIEGDIVLFSPACASFDMFDNYQHRGAVFEQTVMKMVEGSR